MSIREATIPWDELSEEERAAMRAKRNYGRKIAPHRDPQIVTLRGEGWTYRQLGERFKISVERARQIVKREERRAREEATK